MVFGGNDTVRELSSLAGRVAKLFETLGLLNKGSAAASAAPGPGESDTVQPVTSNSLNVTRVGGVTTLIAGAGGAALLLFNVDKAKDAHAIVVAAYASVGVIVAAALLTVAIIIAADIRARAAIAVATPPASPPVSHNSTVLTPTDVSHPETAGPLAGASAQSDGGGATEIVIVRGRTLQIAWDGQSSRVE
jgi:hypothetical protein